jgi:23S rRNA maturation-related 3'-5' exoribonuclease YhaM
MIEKTLFALQTVKRDGIEDLIAYLQESDYFTAPASTKYHNCFAGGLCLHSLNVMFAFRTVDKTLSNPLPKDSIVICGLLHDLCKIGVYKETEDGYTSKWPKGHATISLERIKKYIELTDEEEDIILYHMGLFGVFTYKEYNAVDLHEAIIRTPQVQIFAALDMIDSKHR